MNWQERGDHSEKVCTFPLRLSFWIPSKMCKCSWSAEQRECKMLQSFRKMLMVILIRMQYLYSEGNEYSIGISGAEPSFRCWLPFWNPVKETTYPENSSRFLNMLLREGGQKIFPVLYFSMEFILPHRNKQHNPKLNNSSLKPLKSMCLDWDCPA